jgi:hypothetical protein
MAWEFAYHVLHKEASLVILLMAWMTPQHLSVYSAKSREPDMDILAYWIARLEPLVRAEDEGEIIVVLTNRCGVEGDAVYAGTSCVLGVEDGEVKVYGVLGRGDKDLLVVDTSMPPQYKVVAKPETEIWAETAASHNTPGLVSHKVAGTESPGLETAQEGQRLISSIDAFLAERAGFPPVEQNSPKNPLSTNTCADTPRLGEPLENARSTIPANDSQSPSTSISSSIASSICEPEGLLSPYLSTVTLDYSAIPEEGRREMVQILPHKNSG